jgi:hypothetical protein
VANLVEAYDAALARLFQLAGYARVARGLYVQSETEVIWQGLFVSFRQRKASLSVQPSLGIYCPAAFEVVAEGLGQNLTKVEREPTFKLGYPFIAHPLYDRVRALCREDRQPFSYDVASDDQIEDAVRQVFEDFTKVAAEFFGGISSVRELKERIIAQPAGLSAGVYAMALSYTAENDISFDRIDELAGMCPSPMTDEFAVFVKKKIERRDAQKRAQ